MKETARENAERIINKDNTRVVRTDDIGRVNDPLYDHVEIDAKGNIVDGSGSQMKFVGSNPEQALDRLASKKFEKYLDADAKIEVPSDYYDGIKAEAKAKIDSLQKQVDTLKIEGKTDIAAQKQAELEKYKKIDKNLEKSHVSNKEAIEARTNPEISTAKDVVGVSHRAGLEAAKSGAAIGGGISLVRNIVAVAKGDKEADEATLAVIKDTGTGAIVGYGTAFAGSALKGAMQNADDVIIRSLSKTNLPAQIVTVALETGKTLAKYAKGEIDGVECVRELGEKGTGMVGSAALGAYTGAIATATFGKSFEVVLGSLGTIAIPIPVVGTMIGSMVGYFLGTVCYSNLLESAKILKEAKLAREERIRIEKECAQAIAMICEYRMEMEKMISEYLCEHIEVFHSAFNDIKSALAIGDIDGFIGGANSITKKLGGTTQFDTYDEFNTFMESSEAFKL